MPLTLTLMAAPRRRFVDQAPAVPFWQLLHREADTLYPELRTLWATIFADTGGAIDREVLETALARGNLLEAEHLVTLAWEAEGVQPARALLPQLLRQTAAAAGVAMLPETARVLNVPRATIAFNTVDPAVLQAVDEYAGTEIRAISQRTLLAVRQTLRAGLLSGDGVATQARHLREIIGLTPGQARAIGALRGRLLAEGVSARQVTVRVDVATRRAVRVRTTAIARSESLRAASLGQQALWEELARDGVLTEAYVRTWLVTPDDRLCPGCRAIPGLNSEGVGLTVPFATPYGPIFTPPAHVQCRCSVSLVLREDALRGDA
jgi:hypothetical protein